MEDFEDFDEEYEDFLRYRAEKQLMDPSAGVSQKQKAAFIEQHKNGEVEDLKRLFQEQDKGKPKSALRAALQHVLREKGVPDSYFIEEAATRKAQAGAAAEDATPVAATENTTVPNQRKTPAQICEDIDKELSSITTLSKQNCNGSLAYKTLLILRATHFKLINLDPEKNKARLIGLDKKRVDNLKNQIEYLQGVKALSPQSIDDTLKELEEALGAAKGKYKKRKFANQIKKFKAARTLKQANGLDAEIEKLKNEHDVDIYAMKRDKSGVTRTGKIGAGRVGKYQYEHSHASLGHFAARIADLGIDLSSE